MLTLDGDVDFKPSAVQLLVDRIKINDKVGAACGRIHPIGTGLFKMFQSVQSKTCFRKKKYVLLIV